GVTRYTKEKRRITIEASGDVQLDWRSHEGALVDGKPWPVMSAEAVFLPAGIHTVEPGPKRDAIAVVDLNAKLRSAAVESGRRIAFEYSSDSRAIVRFDRKPSRVDVDGEVVPACEMQGECSVMLPRGAH